MSTYRVGHHQPQNVYRESDDDPCPASVDGRCAESGEIHPKCKPGQCRYDQTDARRGQLVAVVVNGDRDLAERICALLNGDPCTRVGLHNCAGEWRNHDRDGGRP